MERMFRTITIVSLTRAFFLTILIGLLAFTTPSSLRADNKDTPDDVMRVGKSATAELNSMLAALRDVQAITTRMGQDRAFATRVLEAAKKNDRQGLAALLKSVAPASQITVREIRDFCIGNTFCTQSRCYDLCIGDCCKHPSGAKSPIVFQEF